MSCPAADGGDFIEQTIATWQPLTGRRLTREDGRQIAENVSGFFRILAEWDRAERNAEKAARPRRPKQPDDRPSAVLKDATESTSTLAAPQQAAPL